MKIIFWALIGYILYRWLLGNRLPTGRRGAESAARSSSRPEGDIRVDRNPTEHPPGQQVPSADDGEYVDYEEVD